MHVLKGQNLCADACDGACAALPHEVARCGRSAPSVHACGIRRACMDSMPDRCWRLRLPAWRR